MARKLWTGVALAVAAAGSVAAAEDAKHWGYDGEEGPAHWSEIAPDNAACAVGSQQSPIDITGTIRAELPPLRTEWKPATGTTVVNNGHTLQVTVPPGSLLTRGDQTYEMLQFHFHSPSEHRIEGKTYPMEVHFVHQNKATGALGVVGAFIEEGGENAAFHELADEFPTEAGAQILDDRIDPNSFLPASLEYFEYEGSLTTPPCSEIVDWMVLRDPIQVGAEDIAKFKALYESNARPPVAANRRFILSSF